MTVPRTAWLAGMRITGDRLAASDVQAGLLSVSFTSLSSYTRSVTFPEAFPVAPVMFVEIASGAGTTGRYEARPINITPTGFTLFVLLSDAAEGADTWTDVPVHWIAQMPA